MGNRSLSVGSMEKAKKGIKMTEEGIKNSRELEFAVFCIESVAAKLDVGAELIYKAFTEKSDILNGYIVPEYKFCILRAGSTL